MTADQLFIHIPAPLLPGRLPFLLNRNLQPELACQDVSIDKLNFDQLGDCARQLKKQGLSTTLHAPYSGFNPGSSKKPVRKFSQAQAEKSLLLAEKIGAERVVFHPGLAYGSEGEILENWVEACCDFWPEFLERARNIGCVICIENIYETDPEVFIQLLSSINSPQMGHVFDIGHWNMFGTTKLLDWLNRVEPYLQHLHLHDNQGERDEHLAIGRGNVPFSTLFEWLKSSAINPTMTLENHSLPNTELSLQAIYRNFPELQQ